MDVTDIGWDGRDWIDVAQNRDQWWAVVSTGMNFRIPYNVRKFFSGCATGDF
jgi:hypothetical protein